MPTMLFAKPEIMILVRLTCPIALFSHYPISLSWVLLANAATYALVGIIVEMSKLISCTKFPDGVVKLHYAVRK